MTIRRLPNLRSAVAIRILDPDDLVRGLYPSPGEDVTVPSANTAWWVHDEVLGPAAKTSDGLVRPFAERMICVDPGSSVVDPGDPFGITLTTVWGIDAGTPYYDDAGAAAGDEAGLFYDPAIDQYVLVAYDF